MKSLPEVPRLHFIPLFLSVCLSCNGLLLAHAGTEKQAGYTVDARRVESPAEFSAFLNHCNLEERILLMQSLRGLHDRKLEEGHFGKLAGLPELSHPAEKDKGQGVGRTSLTPDSFNDVPVETVLDAIGQDLLDEELFSEESISRRLAWCRYNKLVRPFVHRAEIDYHEDIVLWLAKRWKLEEIGCGKAGTMEIERKFSEEFFRIGWDRCPSSRRLDLLSGIDSVKSGEKTSLATADGAMAIEILSHSEEFSGADFYSLLLALVHQSSGCSGQVKGSPMPSCLVFPSMMRYGESVAYCVPPVPWWVRVVDNMHHMHRLFQARKFAHDAPLLDFVAMANMLKEKWDEGR